MATMSQGRSSGPARLPSMTHRVRTFYGCLTCRKRKVKCDAQQSPCKNCDRLSILCTPSFPSNFKNSSLDVHNGNRSTETTLSKPNVPSGNRDIGSNFNETLRKGVRKRQSASNRASSLAGNKGTSQREVFEERLSTHDGFTRTSFDRSLTQPEHGFNGHLTRQSDELTPWLSDDIPNIFSYGAEDITYDLGFQQCQLNNTPGSIIMTNLGFQPHPFNMIRGGGDNIPWDNGRLHAPVGEISLANSSATAPTIDIGCADLYPNHTDAISPDTRDAFIPTPRVADSRRTSDWGISSEVPQANSSDMVLIRHYESTMSTFFSVKLPQWNFYTYMLRSQERSNSPLWNSIMAWTSLHLARRDVNPTKKSAIYYDNASDAVQKLLKELSSEAQAAATLASESTLSSEKLYMVLSTTFFLGHCDLMSCNRHAFSERLDALKLVLRRNWEMFRGKIGSLASRLLIWLAYLDLRASLWGNPDIADRTAHHIPVLLDMLNDLNALPSLRSVSENQSYLSECFGDNYPSTELREDLVQEPVNATSDDIMCILSRVKAFETWNDEMIRKGIYEEDAVVRELKTTKVQALRAEIASIRAELKSAFPVSLNNRTNIDRTSFHYLTVSALQLSSTILLNRILEPNLRTDEESQSAALGICKITHQLRRTGCLRTPRSLIWPLPIFIAGIETTDVIYQDWILDYMTEMEDWGPNMTSMRFLLCNIIKRQERENRRVKVKHVMEDFDLCMIL